MKLISNIKKILNFLLEQRIFLLISEIIGAIVALTAFYKLLEGIQILSKINDILIKTSDILQISRVPLVIWLSVPFILYVYFKNKRNFSLIAGDFSEDFKNGLDKWEFGGEGWKIEFDNNEAILSVSESQDGGIAKRGFNWRDYEFNFDTKIINKSSGWIVRALSRSKCLMIQLNLEDIEKPKIRFHLRMPGSVEFPWIVLREEEIKLRSRLKLLRWIHIKTVISGSNIDVFINKEHVAHYFIADPIRLPKEISGEKVILKEGSEEKNVTLLREYVPMEYWVGTVGFRCSGDEHSHFKRVRVKSLF